MTKLGTYKSPMLFVDHQKPISCKPDAEGPFSKVWNIRQDETIRINLVEMSGALKLHHHPDAEHGLPLMEGRGEKRK